LKKDLGTQRAKLSEIASYKDTPFPIVISGLRRAGKSTLLAQLAHKFYPEGGYFYVNFEEKIFLTQLVYFGDLRNFDIIPASKASLPKPFEIKHFFENLTKNYV